MKIAIAQIWQEQNTFSPNLTDFKVFKSNGFFIGDEIISNLKGISPANLNMLKFYKINKPLYPFDEINNFIPKLIIN